MIGNYRTAEGEFLDLTNKTDLKFLQENYPAVMNNRPVGMSEHYQFMPTWKLGLQLQEEFGMGLVAVGQQFSRKRNPEGQEHFLRFRMPSSEKLSTGDSFPEMVLFNSHNGRSKIRAYAGLFRLVCANGMVVSESSFGKIDLRHFGESNSYQAFAAMLADMAVKFKSLDERLTAMHKTILTVGQQHQLARMMIDYRGAPGWVMPEMVIVHHREEDAPNEDGTRSLWLTFNVIQENLTSREDIAFEREGYRRRTIRPLTGARAAILTNERLWDGLEQWVTRNIPAMGVVQNTLNLPKHQDADLTDEGDPVDGSPIEDAVVVSETPGNAQETVAQDEAPLAEAVVAEDHGQQAAGQETIVLRSFSEVMELTTYEDMEAVTDEERAAFTADEKKKFSSRKSYLKRK